MPATNTSARLITMHLHCRPTRVQRWGDDSRARLKHQRSFQKTCSCAIHIDIRSACGRSRMTTWYPVAVTLLVAGVIVGAMCTLNMLIGPKRPSQIKGESFECGNPPSGSAWGRFSVRFYLTAILFLLFDVEVIFLYPWAVELRHLGMFGFVEALIFIIILFVGLLYAWQRGALDWD